MSITEESLDSIDDQESKLEEGKCLESDKRLYQGRRRHLLRRDRNAAASEAKEEEEEKGEETTRAEESKDSSLSPLPSKARSSALPVDSNDEEKLAPRTSMLLTSSSSTYLGQKPFEEKLKGKFQRHLLTSADLIPEVHFLGELCEGIGFRGTSISCKW